MHKYLLLGLLHIFSFSSLSVLTSILLNSDTRAIELGNVFRAKFICNYFGGSANRPNSASKRDPDQSDEPAELDHRPSYYVDNFAIFDRVFGGGKAADSIHKEEQAIKVANISLKAVKSLVSSSPKTLGSFLGFLTPC